MPIAMASAAATNNEQKYISVSDVDVGDLHQPLPLATEYENIGQGRALRPSKGGKGGKEGKGGKGGKGDTNKGCKYTCSKTVEKFNKDYIAMRKLFLEYIEAMEKLTMDVMNYNNQLCLADTTVTNKYIQSADEEEADCDTLAMSGKSSLKGLNCEYFYCAASPPAVDTSDPPTPNPTGCGTAESSAESSAESTAEST